MPRTIDLRQKREEPRLELLNKTNKTENSDNIRSEDSPTSRQMSGISWRTLSFYPNSRRRSRIALLVSLWVGAGILTYFFKDYLFSILLLLFSIVLIINSGKEPESLDVKVDHAGVEVNNERYYYRQLKSFWIDYDPPQIAELSLETDKIYLPHIKIQMEDTNPLELHSLMISYLPEKEHERSLMDGIAKFLGI